jgi:transposase
MFLRGISMKKLLEILRLNFDNKLSIRQISKMSGASKSTVNNYINLFTKSGVSWPLDEQYLDENVLSNKLNPEYKLKTNTKVDFITIHNELKQHKKLTLQLLWEEYNERGEMPYSYGHLALLYRKWQNKQPEYMRQSHKAGEKVFVDYSGDTIRIYDEKTGQIKHNAQIFVSVLGASNYMYIEATVSQKLCDWTMSHVRMFEHFGGVPELVVIDNLKSGVSKASRYDPDITPAYYHMLSHYKTGAMPARVATPKDKAKAENGVLIIQRWVLMRLRKIRFTSLHDLNKMLFELMMIVNNKKMKLYQCSRLELFNKLDKPALKQLPEHQYNYQDYKKSRVGGDYHVELERHYYSVPYNLAKEEVDVWYTANKVEVYYKNKCIAKHVRSHEIGTKTTVIEHMPIGHREFHEFGITKIKQMAKDIGIATELIVEQIIVDSEHESIGCKKSYGFLKLAKKYGNANLENACNYAFNIGISNYKNIEILLKNKVIDFNESIPYHRNIRGANYYN